MDLDRIFEFRTPSEAARELGISRDRVKELVAQGELRAVRSRLGLLVDPDSIAVLAAARAVR